MPPDVEGAVLGGRIDGALIRMPSEPGPYRRYRIRLTRLDLSRIKMGFVVVPKGKRVPVGVCLDSIRFVR